MISTISVFTKYLVRQTLQVNMYILYYDLIRVIYFCNCCTAALFNSKIARDDGNCNRGNCTRHCIIIKRNITDLQLKLL